MEDLPLRVAHQQTIMGLLEMIPKEDSNPPSDDTSFDHLFWMMTHCMEHLFVWPIDKISRWIGCVQGVMRCRGVLDFGAERDRTRPIFHKAYEAMGQTIPKTTERPTLEHPLAQRVDKLMQTGENSAEKLAVALEAALKSDKIQNIVVGEVMKALHGGANPAAIAEELTKRLDR
jgi:hypothetical protein